MADELAALKKDIDFVGQFTDAPEQILALLQRTWNQLPVDSSLTEQEKVFVYIDQIKWELSWLHIEGQIKGQCTFTKEKHAYFAKGWNPFIWTIAPHYEKAMELYLKLLRRYARLHALKNIIDTVNWKAEKVDSIEATVQQIIDLLNTMIRTQVPRIWQNAQLKAQQVAKLVEVKSQINALSRRCIDQKYHSLRNILQQQINSLNTASTQIFLAGRPNPDPVLGLLRLVHQKVQTELSNLKQ